MKHKFWKWVTNAALDAFGSERTLYLDGQISDETWWGDEVTPKAFKDELNAGSGDITLWINSPGGDCFAAAQIYNMLMDYPGNVTVKIDGLAASAASVIAMAGTKVCMSPVAILMIHNPATMDYGDKAEMEKTVSWVWRWGPMITSQSHSIPAKLSPALRLSCVAAASSCNPRTSKSLNIPIS